jgi:hypothetical protein
MMTFVRICLVIVIGSLALVMFACPKLYDSTRMARATYHYSNNPSDASLRELKEAEAADRRGIFIFESVAGILLVGCVVALVYAEKRAMR